MYRQCDMQQDNTVLRGWIPERSATEGAEVRISGLDGLWNVTRTYGYALEDLGLQKMPESFIRRNS